jgi:hypothetical protein
MVQKRSAEPLALFAVSLFLITDRLKSIRMISAEPLALGWLISPIGTADITALDFNPLQIIIAGVVVDFIHCR